MIFQIILRKAKKPNGRRRKKPSKIGASNNKAETKTIYRPKQELARSQDYQKSESTRVNVRK